jgi:AAA family ATP:ADP antiporter
MANVGVADPDRPFGKWRSVFWPVHAYELKKIIPMLAMFFFISLIYSLLRNTKDTLIVTAAGGGAELIPFLKLYGVIPGSVVYVLFYVKLSNAVSRYWLFILALIPFLLFYSIFIGLYSVRESIEPVELASRLQSHLPKGLGHLVAILRHWVLSLFYVMAELWGSIALSLLFWGFANDITRVEEAKRFYALFGIGANLALMAVKIANGLIHFLQGRLLQLLSLDRWTAYLAVLLGIVVLSITIIIAIYVWMNKRVLNDPRFSRPRSADPSAPARGTFLQSLKLLGRERVLRFIAILVIAYGVAINLIEVTWKSYLGMQYPNPGDYQDYMVNFSFATGLTAVFIMLFVASNVIRSFGWTVAALVTPVVLLITGIGFFGFILGQGLGPWFQVLGMTPLALGVLFGTIQNVLSKSAKYALFDPTKEMAYIPLGPEARAKGKAAIDVIGARIGKAGGSLLQQGLIAVYGSLRAITAQIAILLLAIIGVWIWADLGLGREFARQTRKRV